MKKFEFLEHTADAKFRAYGKTLEEAFENAALAMFNVIVETKNIKPKIKKTINVTSENLESLLYDFLENLLILVDTESFLLNNIEISEIKKNKEYHLKAEVVGDEASSQYEILEQIKAVTYNEMFIKQEGEKWVIQVVVDI